MLANFVALWEAQVSNSAHTRMKSLTNFIVYVVRSVVHVQLGPLAWFGLFVGRREGLQEGNQNLNSDTPPRHTICRYSARRPSSSPQIWVVGLVWAVCWSTMCTRVRGRRGVRSSWVSRPNEHVRNYRIVCTTCCLMSDASRLSAIRKR